MTIELLDTEEAQTEDPVEVQVRPWCCALCFVHTWVGQSPQEPYTQTRATYSPWKPKMERKLQMTPQESRVYSRSGGPYESQAAVLQTLVPISSHLL